MTEKTTIETRLRALGRMAPRGCCIQMHFRGTVPVLRYGSFDPRWCGHYRDAGYPLRDPLIAWGFAQAGMIRWSDPALPDPYDMLPEAARFGLRYGVTLSCGTLRSRSIASFARADREFSDPEVEALELRLERMHEATAEAASLTDAQREALRCLAEGDRGVQAAKRLGISHSALKARLSAARIRLQARTTAEAIRRARDFDLF